MALSSVGLTTQIYNNHIKSVLLLMGFPVLLLLMLASFFGALNVFTQPQSMVSGQPVDWNAAVNAATEGLLRYGHWAVLAAGVWFIFAYFFQGQMISAASGARPVTRAEYPKLYNMLENLCISRGLPVPQFEIIDSPALNAFATGLDQKTYRIVLTRALVEHLPDDELESVIGHELTHIMNRDVRLLVIAVIFVGIISFLAELVFRLLINGVRPNYYDRDRKNNGIVVIGVALAVLAIGYIFAIVIRFALSRKREYLADAGSVELTKNPEAMMRALLRISGQDKVDHMPDSIQQMCIENSSHFMWIFSTHPPIEDRVKMISDMTHTPIPELTASPRPIPTRPWDKNP